MSNRALTLMLLCALSTMVACKKEEIDPETLTTNPFDADYAGAPIFTLVSSATSSILVNGVPVQRLTAVVQVHTELFGRPTPYTVQYRQLPSGEPATASSTFLPDDRLSLVADGVQAGVSYCWAVNVGNGGAFGGGNQICATAE